VSANGYLTRAELAPITRAANGEQAYLRKDAAAAFMAMNALSERKHDVTLRVSSARVAYRPYADQLYFWLLYLSGRGELAAKPGTSRHGLGLLWTY
jgi:LAS superfamily LD-carboxypeptidase LdcB